LVGLERPDEHSERRDAEPGGLSSHLRYMSRSIGGLGGSIGLAVRFRAGADRRRADPHESEDVRAGSATMTVEIERWVDATWRLA
jgi:hypothetical protein